MFFAIWLFAPKIAKIAPRIAKMIQDGPQNGLKLAILRPKMAILVPSWRQVGQLSAMLAPTWPILAPRWAPRGTFFAAFSEVFAGIARHLQKATKMIPRSSQNDPKMI